MTSPKPPNVTVQRVTVSAPRLHEPAVRLLEELAASDASVAAIRRALVVQSRVLHRPPPSYEHVRRLVARRRAEIAEARESAIVPLVIDAALGFEHGNEVLRVARGGRRRRHR